MVDDAQLREKIKNKLEQYENIILIFIELLPNLKQSDNNITDANNNSSSSSSNASHPAPTTSTCLLTLTTPSGVSSSQRTTDLNETTSHASSNNTEHLKSDNLSTTILKLFAKQLFNVRKLDPAKNEDLYRLYPNLTTWFSLFNIANRPLAVISDKVDTFFDLFDKSGSELTELFSGLDLSSHQVHSICTAFESLKSIYKTLETKQSTSDEAADSSHLPSLNKTLSSDSSCAVNNNGSNNKSNQVNVPQRSKQQRKSESDVQVNSVLFNQPSNQSNNSIISNTTNATKPAESAPSAKSQAYAPTFLNKTNKKPHKVTTPPPSRKNAITQVNPSTSATATAAVAAAAAVAVASTGTNNSSHLPNTSSHHVISSANTFEYPPSQNSAASSNFTRSSSHESHLRNKIEPFDANQLNQFKQKLINSRLVSVDSTTQNSGDIQNLNPNFTAKLSSFPSTTPQTPTSLTSKFYSNSNTNSVNEVNHQTGHYHHHDSNALLADPHKTSSSSSLSYLNGGLMYPCQRKGSVEGSDSSRGQSGQTSPINMPNSPTRLNNKSAINQSYEDIDGNLKNKSNNSLSVPKSPKVKEHRWKNTLKVAYCVYCKKRILIGLKCIACKIRCHRECEKKLSPMCPSIAQFPSPGLVHVPPLSLNHDNNNVFHTNISSSGLPSPLLQPNCQSQRSIFGTASQKIPNQSDSWYRYNNSSFSAIDEQGNPSSSWQSSSVGKFMNRIVSTITTPIQSQRNPKILNNLESKSSSSCNSSEPNSPGLKNVQHLYNNCLSPSSLSYQRTNTIQSQSNEFFPKLPSDHSIDSSRFLAEKREDEAAAATLSKAGSRAGLDENQNVEGNHGNQILLNDEAMRGDDYNDNMNNESDFNQSGYSQDLQQFNITYEEITDKIEIGRGRFSKVYKAQWHGPHAIKEIDLDDHTFTDNSEQLTFIKEEVLNLRKTRHANLILFVGACVKPPVCAIVMSLCRGVCLHKYLHTDSYPKPNIDWTINIAIQIAQGMAYLHNKQMIHKDLRSKNIFIEGNKAVITDFGLYAITRLCKKNLKNGLLPVTKECIYYMAPELIKSLGKPDFDDKFTYASDVFSFGTVWYELFCNEYPFSSNSAHSVIYLIGSGLKNISSSIQIPKEFKAILLKCWSSDPSARPDFSQLLETFRAVPKRKLIRSPSHPQIGRSLETLNVND